jgi:hypothetical protein
MSSHTPEPWHVDRFNIHAKRGECCVWINMAIGFNGEKPGESTANAHRIVACVNALAGVENPAAELARLREEVERLEKELREAYSDNAPPPAGVGELRQVDIRDLMILGKSAFAPNPAAEAARKKQGV